MKRVNLCKPIENLRGVALKDNGVELIGNEVIANILTASKAEKDPVRQLSVALTLYTTKGPVNLEDADYSLIERAISKSDMSALVAGRLLNMLKELVKEKK